MLLFWSAGVRGSPAPRSRLWRGALAPWRGRASASVAIALDPPADLPQVRPWPLRPCRSILATPELGLSYAILNRHLFMNRQDLRLPTALLLDGTGSVVKAYRGPRWMPRSILRDAATIERACRSGSREPCPFRDVLLAARPCATTFPTGGSCSIRGSRPPRSSAFERAAQANPNASTLYRLGTLADEERGDDGRARRFERALAMQPDLAEASNDLGTLLAQQGQLAAGNRAFRSARLDAEYPDALNTRRTPCS